MTAAVPINRRSGVLPVLEAVAGLLAMVSGTTLLTRSTLVELRVGLAGAGLVLLYLALDHALARHVGRRVETGYWLAVVWAVAIVLTALLADVLPLGEHRLVSQTLTEPSLARPDLLSSHPLGTDRFGLDLLASVVYGARVSLLVGFGAVAMGGIVGGFFGLLAGYYRGWVDRIISVIVDSLLAFPPLVLLLALVAVLQPSLRNVTIGLAVLSMPTFVRVVRANTLSLAEREFVSAARALGATDARIMVREILPNVGLPVLSYALLILAVLIVAEASLSFLGLSIQRPDPTWGNLIAAGQSSLGRHPHLVFAPGVVLFVTVLSFNRIGDRLRRQWDDGPGA